MSEIKLYDILHPIAQAKRAEWRGDANDSSQYKEVKNESA